MQQMDNKSFGNDFLETVIQRVKYYKDLGDKTIKELTKEELHYHPNEESNSIAIIIQHMHGNMLSRWTNFLTEDGEKEWRQRDGEFEIHDSEKETIIALWEQGWECFLNALNELKPGDLGKTILIRREALTVTDAINRQLAHYPYHVGQIVYIGKMLKNKEWKSLSIPRGNSKEYSSSGLANDPAKRFSK